jgi:hypothetical protein
VFKRILPVGLTAGFLDSAGCEIVKLMLIVRSIRLLLPLFAALGLLAGPLVAPSGATTMVRSMDGMQSVTDSDMPCCPPEKPAIPDCHKGCLSIGVELWV